MGRWIQSTEKCPMCRGRIEIYLVEEIDIYGEYREYAESERCAEGGCF